LSNTSLVFDGIVAKIKEALPDRRWLADAYDVENNDIISLKNGYSVGFGPSNNARIEMCPDLRTQRTFPITFTTLYNDHETNPVKRSSDEKKFMEEMILVAKSLEKSTSLGGVSALVRYEDDTGIQYLFGDDDQSYISIVVVVSAAFNT